MVIALAVLLLCFRRLFTGFDQVRWMILTRPTLCPWLRLLFPFLFHPHDRRR
jgi:hypothetical protein